MNFLDALAEQTGWPREDIARAFASACQPNDEARPITEGVIPFPDKHRTNGQPLGDRTPWLKAA